MRKAWLTYFLLDYKGKIRVHLRGGGHYFYLYSPDAGRSLGKGYVYRYNDRGWAFGGDLGVAGDDFEYHRDMEI